MTAARRLFKRCWQALQSPAKEAWHRLIGLGALLFAAIGVVVQLKDALNTVWEVEESKESGVWHFLRTYVLSLAAVIAVGFLLLVSLLMTAGIAALGKLYASSVPEGLLQPIGFAASFAVVALLFALMFKYLPDAEVSWRDVWLGAVVTALLFEVGKFLIGLYIGKQGLEFELRRGFLPRRGPDLGLLLGPDRADGRGVYPRPCLGKPALRRCN